MIFQAHVPPAWPFKRESFLKDGTRRDHDNLKDARVHSRLISPSLSCITNPIVLKPPRCSNYLQNLTILHHRWLSSYCDSVCVWPSSRNVDIPRLQASVSSKGCRSTVFRFQRLLTVMTNIEYWTWNITEYVMELNSIEKNQQASVSSSGHRSTELFLTNCCIFQFGLPVGNIRRRGFSIYIWDLSSNNEINFKEGWVTTSAVHNSIHSCVEDVAVRGAVEEKGWISLH